MRHWALYKMEFFFVDLPLFVRGASPFACLTFFIAVNVVIVIIVIQRYSFIFPYARKREIILYPYNVY